jgi:hypothetical protein
VQPASILPSDSPAVSSGHLSAQPPVDAEFIDIPAVGSEGIRRDDVIATQLIADMSQVRQALPSNISVTTADAYGIFLENPGLIAASDIVFANFYPYWGGTSINNALCSQEQEHPQLVTASGSKRGAISETGWPTGGATMGATVPCPANGGLYSLQVLSWTNWNNISVFCFEAFDERWKTAYQGPQDTCWGIFEANDLIKPSMDSFFNGQTVAINRNGLIPGPLAIRFSYVLSYGGPDNLEAQGTGVQPAGFRIATHILLNVGWWTKPTFAQPTVPVYPDGSALVTLGTSQVWSRPDRVGDSLPRQSYRRIHGLPIPGCRDVNREEI